MAEQVEENHEAGDLASPMTLQLQYGARWNAGSMRWEFADGSKGMFSPTEKTTVKARVVDHQRVAKEERKWEQAMRMGDPYPKPDSSPEVDKVVPKFIAVKE